MMTKNTFIIASGIIIGLMFPAFNADLIAQEVVPAKTDTIVACQTPGRLFNSTGVNNTQAVSTLKGEDINSAATSITNSLFGVLPGLIVTQGSGEPGFDHANLSIRGIGTFNTGSYNSSVIFVDGFQVDANYFYNMPASKVESISILKDAASLVTFGNNGANGVIWIVTKKTKVGKPMISLNFQSGFGSPEIINKPLNSFNYANLYNQAVSNDHNNVWTPYYSGAQLQAYQNGAGTNVDWYDQVLRKQAPYTSGNINLTGGDVHTLYNILFDYMNQQGLYNVANAAKTSNEQFKRYGLKGNLAFNWGIFEAKVDINARLEDRMAPNYVSNFSTSPIWADLAKYPNNIYPVYDDPDNQHLSGTTIFKNNPVGTLNGLGWESNQTRYLMANFNLKEKLDLVTKGLYLTEAVSFLSNSISTYNKTANYARYINGATTTTDQTTSILASARGANAQEDWKQAIVTLGYDHSFEKGIFSSAVNYHLSQFTTESVNNRLATWQNVSGRFNYTYDNRYIAELGFSYFGSDAYAPAKRWNLYPAFSGGWIASNETFLKDNQVVSYLKLRGSYGLVGGENSANNILNNGRYLYQQYYVGGGSYYVGNTTPTAQGGLITSYIANPNIGPEKSLKSNIGIELTLFKKLDLIMDVFMDKRSRILVLDNTIPADLGNITYYSNIGNMTNKGFEVSASYTNNAGAFNYKLLGTASFNRNVIDYMSEVPTAFPYNAQTGRSAGTPIGLIAAGLYQTTDFNANGTLKDGIAKPAFGPVQQGDIRYKDLNGDGLIDQTDYTAVGKPAFPELIYSFGANLSYKGFDLKFLFQGTEGSSINLLSSNQTVPFVNNSTAYAIAQGAWAYYPDQSIDTRATATFPRLTLSGNNNNYRLSSYWIKNNDFLRLRYLELGYTFSSKLLKRVKISNLRLYVNATNPITWSSTTKNYNIDPESYNGYPVLKCVNMGFSVNF